MELPRTAAGPGAAAARNVTHFPIQKIVVGVCVRWWSVGRLLHCERA